MSAFPPIHRRILLRLAGAGLIAAPLGATAAAAKKGGAAAPIVAPSGDAVWAKPFDAQRIWAYADRHSVLPGEPLNVMASGGPGQPVRRARLEVFRVGAGMPAPIWQSEFVDIAYRGATATAASLGPGWPPTFASIDTRAWPPGCYYADIVEQTTATRDVRAAFWVVRNPKRSGRVLMKLGTNTYQAYNPWGGHSLYPTGEDDSRGLMVSFDRPTEPSFFEYDAYLVGWLESLAVGLGGVDYAGNFDVHADPTLIDRYPLVITGSHDEYWSGEEFDAFDRRIFKLGKNTVFFGADTAYCQIRYGDLNREPGGVDHGRQMICYKTAHDPIVQRAGKLDPRRLTTNLFRTDQRRPETMLLGGAYQSWFEPTSDQRPAYKVARTDLPFFEGTGWKVGDAAADVVGYEWDNRDPERDGARMWNAARSTNAPVAADAVKVLFSGETVDADGDKGLAEATFFTSKAGAKVFNAGAVRWAWGLGKEGFVNAPFKRFNENLVRALSAKT